MSESSATTAAIERYLIDLEQARGHSSEAPLVRAMLTRSVERFALPLFGATLIGAIRGLHRVRSTSMRTSC